MNNFQALTQTEWEPLMLGLDPYFAQPIKV
jgi:hypothetical protein